MKKIIFLLFSFVIFTFSFIYILYKSSLEQPQFLSEEYNKNKNISITVENTNQERFVIGQNLILYKDSSIEVQKRDNLLFIINNGNFKYSKKIENYLNTKNKDFNNYINIGNKKNNFSNFFDNDIILNISECSRDLFKQTNLNSEQYNLILDIKFNDSNSNHKYYFNTTNGLLDLLITKNNKSKLFNCNTYPISYKSINYFIESIILPEGESLQM